MTTKIAVAGKGGTGKTTIAATIARLVARKGREVWAIDADSNPNLAVALGLAETERDKLLPLPRNLLEESKDDEGKRKLELKIPPRQVAGTFGVEAPDRVRLLLMGRVDHAGAG